MEQNLHDDTAARKKPSFFKRFFVFLLVTILLMAGLCYGAMYVLLRGPSAYAGRIAAVTIVQQPVVCKLLELYLTDEEIAEVEAAAKDGTVVQADGETEKLFSVFPEIE